MDHGKDSIQNFTEDRRPEPMMGSRSAARREAPPARGGHHGLELRCPLAPPHVAGDLLDVLAMNDKAATLGVVPQLAQLQLRVLLARRHVGVDRHPHRPSGHDDCPYRVWPCTIL